MRLSPLSIRAKILDGARPALIWWPLTAAPHFADQASEPAIAETRSRSLRGGSSIWLAAASCAIITEISSDRRLRRGIWSFHRHAVTPL